MLFCDIGTSDPQDRHEDRMIRLRKEQATKQSTPDGAQLRGGTVVTVPAPSQWMHQAICILALREGNAIQDRPRQKNDHANIAGTAIKATRGTVGRLSTQNSPGPKVSSLTRRRTLHCRYESHTIRRIDLKTGTIQTILGDGTRVHWARPPVFSSNKERHDLYRRRENNRVLAVSENLTR